MGGRITQDSSGSLQITSVQNSDGGEYYCLARNTAGSVTSLTAELQVACKWCVNVRSSCRAATVQCVVEGETMFPPRLLECMFS